MTEGIKQPSGLCEPLTSEQEIEQAIEAILFAAGHPIKYEKLAETLGLTVKDAKTMVKELAKRFEQEDSVHGIQLLLYPSSCQLCTKEQFAPYIREALGIRRGGNLSASSMEVLAVVAYNQPVTRSFIDLVRGVDSSYAVNSLLDKGLIEAAGRLDAPGRPMLYVTTDKFLRVFGIRSLEELPETEALSVAAELAQNTEQSDETTEKEPAETEYSAPVDSEETDVIYENGAEPTAQKTNSTEAKAAEGGME